MIPVFETGNFLNENTQTTRQVPLTGSMCSTQEFPQIDEYRNYITQNQMYKSNLIYPFFRFPPSQNCQQNETEGKQYEPSKVTLACSQVWLEHQALWRRFSMSGNEMIITKMGRRMFPVLAFGVVNLSASNLYSMEVEVVPADNNRYKYVSVTGWRVNGVASEHEGNKRMVHPDGIQTGEYWQRNGVAFKRIKLTNKKTAKEGSNQIVLNSMHKYQLQLVIKQMDSNHEVMDTKKVLFKETAFIAVTAYQNDDITQLKIDHNPFAKAFRDTAGDNSELPSSPDDIYSLSPKRRRYNEYNIMSPTTPTLFHPNYPTSNFFAYNSFFFSNNNNMMEDGMLYRKNFQNNFGQFYSNTNDTKFLPTSSNHVNNTGSHGNNNFYSTVNTCNSTSWYTPLSSNYNEIVSLNQGIDAQGQPSEKCNGNDMYWNYQKVEEQLLSPCSV